jgi:DUF971 family protein
MPGLKPDSPVPTAITLHQASRVLEIEFDDGKRFRLPCEFLRVYSPSAEVRGRYAVQLKFSDGHDTGIYSWDLLYDYGMRQAAMWAAYLERLARAGASRDAASIGGSSG